MTNYVSTEQQALLALVRRGIATEGAPFDFSSLSADQWAEVIRESRAQTVSLLCFDATEDLRDLIPQRHYAAWFAYAASVLKNNMTVRYAQDELVRLLEDAELSYILLKGYASAAYYPDGEKRSFGDVDFLIDPSQQERVEALLLENGYTREMEEHACHHVFKKPNAHLEMHFEVAGIPDGAVGDRFRRYLAHAATAYTLCESPHFHRPTADVHAVVLLLHSLHHLLGEGLGLRHLCDWACFVNATYTEDFWQERVLPLLRETGTLTFAAVLTKTCAVYLGTVCPAWAESAPLSLCGELIADVFALGNFGRKNEERARSGMFSQQGKGSVKKGKLAGLWRTLKDTMYTAYPILRRCRVLYPFVFVWRAVKYLLLMLVGKRPSLAKVSAYADERRATYEQFALFETEEEK